MIPLGIALISHIAKKYTYSEENVVTPQVKTQQEKVLAEVNELIRCREMWPAEAFDLEVTDLDDASKTLLLHELRKKPEYQTLLDHEILKDFFEDGPIFKVVEKPDPLLPDESYDELREAFFY